MDTPLSEHRSPIVLTEISTPIGAMLAGATEEGICLLEFTDGQRSEKQLARLQRMLQAEAISGMNTHLDALSVQLSEYFSRVRKEFDLRLVLAGTPFQRTVWEGLRTIGYGETISYQEEAERIARPRAVRAVARANGDNPVSIVIPCHRVIGKNGKLTGYGGGLWRKERLLALERRHSTVIY